MHNKWVSDGPNAWKAVLGSGRVARIKVKGLGYVCRLTGGDPGAEAYGTYPTLEAAQERFEPGWTPAKDAELHRIPDHLRKPGDPVDVDKEFQDRVALGGA